LLRSLSRCDVNVGVEAKQPWLAIVAPLCAYFFRCAHATELLVGEIDDEHIGRIQASTSRADAGDDLELVAGGREIGLHA
jgi:hypothetical protein